VRMDEENPAMEGRLRYDRTTCHCPLAAKQSDRETTDTNDWFSS
jgi:hypothetical protein